MSRKYRTAHGASAAGGRLTASEALPWDEQPAGVPAPARAESPTDRGDGGQFARGNSLAVRGGKARAGKTRLADRLGLRRLADTADFSPYKKAASSYRRAMCAELARTVGGGICGTGPSSIIGNAALALAWARYWSDVAAANDDADAAVRAIQAMKEVRASLRDAHQMAALEAQTRPPPVFDLAAALRAELPPEEDT